MISLIAGIGQRPLVCRDDRYGSSLRIADGEYDDGYSGSRTEISGHVLVNSTIDHDSMAMDTSGKWRCNFYPLSFEAAHSSSAADSHARLA
jgi:hypothetical protein